MTAKKGWRMDRPQTLEEGTALLAAALDDKTLCKAASGQFGDEIRLLSIGEKTRRERRGKTSTAA